VGTAGLAVAFIGGLIGPVAILVQGQAWRWIWIAVFIGAVLAPFTALQVSRDQRCGPLCALLLVSSWTLPGIDGTACVMLASILWLARERVGSLPITYFRWVTAALGAAIVVWILTKCWTIVSPPTSPSVHVPLGVTQVQNIFALEVPAVLLGALVWLGIRANRTRWVPMFLSALLAAVSVLIFPAAFKQSRTMVAAADIHEFAEWANAIPPTSTILVAPPRDVGGFVWFTLGRPNYLAVDQSSGVVFSRATALEVRRRSEVLVPLMDPNWKILTRLRAKPGPRSKSEASARPLTPENLIQVCSDPQLGFIISQDKVGFEPLRHEHAGAWKDWNLYDCRKVRSALPGT
jgi:hypothetical protein